MKFRAKILQAGKTATGIEVPLKIVESLGSGKRPKVRVTINGYTYRSSIAPMGGVFMIGISADVREKAGVAGGDLVDVGIELDTEPREVTMPPDFKKRLARDAKAKLFFEGLSYSKQRWFVVSIDGAKTAETRERRIAKFVEMLREGRSP